MFKPLNNRVLVKPDKIIDRTASGFLLPESEKEKPVTGIVVVGNENVKEGERVVFSKFGFDEIKIDEEVHYVVSDFNLLGIFL